MSDPISFYGFTPVPRDPDVLFDGHPTANGANPKQDSFSVEDFPLPKSPLAAEVTSFVKVIAIRGRPPFSDAKKYLL
jgi:cyanamide hydratase